MLSWNIGFTLGPLLGGTLIGLTGTVVGLLQGFSQISPDTGLPDPVAFTKGVALALSAPAAVHAQILDPGGRVGPPAGSSRSCRARARSESGLCARRHEW